MKKYSVIIIFNKFCDVKNCAKRLKNTPLF